MEDQTEDQTGMLLMNNKPIVRVFLDNRPVMNGMSIVPMLTLVVLSSLRDSPEIERACREMGIRLEWLDR